MADRKVEFDQAIKDLDDHVHSYSKPRRVPTDLAGLRNLRDRIQKDLSPEKQRIQELSAKVVSLAGSAAKPDLKELEKHRIKLVEEAAKYRTKELSFLDTQISELERLEKMPGRFDSGVAPSGTESELRSEATDVAALEKAHVHFTRLAQHIHSASKPS